VKIRITYLKKDCKFQKHFFLVKIFLLEAPMPRYTLIFNKVNFTPNLDPE